MNKILELVYKAKSKLKSFTKKITFRVDSKETGISQLSLLKIYHSKPNPRVATFLAKV